MIPISPRIAKRHGLSIVTTLLLVTMTLLLLLSDRASSSANYSLSSLASLPAQSEDGLFQATSKRGSLPTDTSPAILQSRFVTVNLSFFATHDSTYADSLTLNLFDGVTLVADRYESRRNLIGNISWLGRIRGISSSQVNLVVGGGVVMGNIVTPDAAYEVRYAGNNTHVIYRIDPLVRPGDHSFEQDYQVPDLPNGPDEPVASDPNQPVEIDVMVLWTPAARTQAGGEAAIRNQAQLSVDLTNTAFANSQVIHRLVLVHAAEIAYSDDNEIPSTLWRRLQDPDDGYMDDAHPMRDQHGADLVSLLSKEFDFYEGGYASLMQHVSISFAPYAFSVSKWRLATEVGYRAFAHEVGHNMGNAHDRPLPEGGIEGAYPYSYGYLDQSKPFRDIMAVRCPNPQANCNGILHFSNPDVLYEGSPTGVDIMAPNAASAALTLNNTGPTVARFRNSVRPPTPTPLTPVPTPACTIRTFSSTDVPRPIPDEGTITSTLTLNGVSPVDDVDLILNIRHPRINSLQITLISPGGVRVRVISNICPPFPGTFTPPGTGTPFPTPYPSPSPDFNNVTLDDGAEQDIDATCSTATAGGVFRPMEALLGFRGQRNGTWKLVIESTTSGTLDGWSLQVRGNCGPSPTPVATPTPCTPGSFSDVPTGSTFHPFVSCLVNRGVIGGYDDCTFRPGNPITRGQLSKIVANSAGYNENHAVQTFQDVPSGSTFHQFVERMASRGIIGGYECGGPNEPCVSPGNRPYFRTNANATRGQITKIVSNAKGYNDTSTEQSFQDVPSTNPFYIWVQRLATRAIMGGYECGASGEPCIPPNNRPYFRPQNNATRGQVSKIVNGAFFPNCLDATATPASISTVTPTFAPSPTITYTPTSTQTSTPGTRR